MSYDAPICISSQHEIKPEIQSEIKPEIQSEIRSYISENDLLVECRDHMAQNGLAHNAPIVADGKIHRYSIDNKKNQPDEWYVAWEGISVKGNSYLWCVYGSWSDASKCTFRSWESAQFASRLDDEERKAFHKSHKERMIEVERLLLEERDLAAKKAKDIWESASQEPPGENHLRYTHKKGISPIGVRFTQNPGGYDSIVIPLRNIDEKIRSLQFISVTDDGKVYKSFLSGGQKKGNFFTIGQIINTEPLYVVEGYATGISVHEATRAAVVVAFDAGNLASVIKNLRNKYPKNKIIIAGDNGDAGESNANDAAALYGCGVVFPEFPPGKELDEKGNKFSDFNDLQSIFGIDEVVRQIKKCSEQRIFEPYSLNDLLKMPEKKWLIDQVIGNGDIGMIYGAPGSGKTFLAIDMSISACLGAEWANKFKIAHPLNVAYCAGEGVSGLKSRFQAAVRHHNVNPSDLKNFTFFKTMPQFFSNSNSPTEDSIEKFIYEWRSEQNQRKAEPLDLIFIDTLHTATISADENSARDMGRVLHLCRHLSKTLECSVIFVHHSNKAATAERGSSALRGAMDVMLEIKKPTETSPFAIMECSKLKDGEQWKGQRFSLNQVEETKSVCVKWGGSFDPSQQKGKMENYIELIKCVMKDYPENKFKIKTIAEAIGQSENYTRNLLSEMVQGKICKRDLQDSKKEKSSQNPWVYQIS